MKRAITTLLLILFAGLQADDVVRLCAEWLCPEGQTHDCCHLSQSGKSRLKAKVEAGHCAPADAASPLELNRALCCESSSEAARNIFRAAERFPKDTFRQFLLGSAKPSGLPSAPADFSSADILTAQFLQAPSPPNLLSTVLRI